MGTASQGSKAWRAGVLEAVEDMESCDGGGLMPQLGKQARM